MTIRVSPANRLKSERRVSSDAAFSVTNAGCPAGTLWVPKYRYAAATSTIATIASPIHLRRPVFMSLRHPVGNEAGDDLRKQRDQYYDGG